MCIYKEYFDENKNVQLFKSILLAKVLQKAAVDSTKEEQSTLSSIKFHIKEESSFQFPLINLCYGINPTRPCTQN